LNPTFVSIYEGFPVAGLTGTLEGRYFSTAPEAIGLVHAKTGTLDGTVSLAGYVDAGDREYIFVVIADRIPKGTLATTAARNTIDHLLGKIASPLTVAR
jgi:D-alanyl-D-alanine carboxypeptidase